MFGIEVDGHFDAAHFLTNYHGKCENIHGHRYKVVVSLAVQDDALLTDGTEKDMVVDFTRAKRLIGDICDQFDHTFIIEKGSLKPRTKEVLQDEGFELLELPFRTTAENLAREIYRRCLKQDLPVQKVEVDETPKNRAFYIPGN